jgi:hypothetical protein
MFKEYEIDVEVIKAKRGNATDVRVPDCPLCKARPKIKMTLNSNTFRDVIARIDCCKQFITECACGNEDYASRQVVRQWTKKVDDWYRDKIVDNARKQITHRGLIYEYEIFLGVRKKIAEDSKVPDEVIENSTVIASVDFGYDANGSPVEGK